MLYLTSVEEKLMKRSFDLLLSRRFRPLFVYCRFASNKSNIKYEGVRMYIDESQARTYFDQWLKSLWFAPGGWTQSTKDNAITVTRRYIPFWNLSLYGSINSIAALSKLSMKSRSKTSIFLNGRQASYSSVRITLNNFSLSDINIYAAQTLDRYNLNKLNISFDNQIIINLNNQEKDIEQWTVDKDTAFHIGWDLNIVSQIKYICDHQATQLYPQYHNHQIKTFHFNINEKKERLLYYPIYVINYQYGSQTDFTCLIDGLTGQVTGDRQYSMTKVALATLVGFYPAVLTALTTLGSLIDPSIGIALASFLFFQTLIPVALIISPLVGLFAKNYPKIYRQRISRQQWSNYRSNSSQFTYDFTSPFQQQYQSYRQQQQQQRTESKGRREEEVPMDLYNLLSISRTATDKEIKGAYLIKAKDLHPDRNPDDKNAEELFKKVNQAYDILSNKYKRKQYDRYGYERVKYS